MMLRKITAWVIFGTIAGACNEIEIVVPTVAEGFVQSPWEKVDVLMVVDNSCSMEPYQEKLASDFGSFFSYFAEAQVDWQLAVVHADGAAYDLGRIRGPIVTSEAPDPEGLFAEVVNAGTQGGGIEAGLEAAYRALSGYNTDFPREDASTSVIFVSDEQDSSPRRVSAYVNRFYEIHGPRQRQAFNASALTVTELADCDPEQFLASAPGTRYVEVARLTGGISANLCVDDFEPIVRELALTTSAMLDTFYLGTRPDLTTLTVSVDGTDIPCEEGIWTYQLVDRDGVDVPAIVFDGDSLPPPSADVVAEYTRGQGRVEDFCPGLDL